MDQITYILNAVIARLSALGLPCAVLPYPDKNFEEYEPLHNNGEILVMYAGEEDGETDSMGPVVHERAMLFELTFIFSSLLNVGGIGGLYANLEAVRLSLTGFQPVCCAKKTVLHNIERVKRYKKRWWQYNQTWAFSGLNVEDTGEQLIGALLTRITIKTGDQSNDVTA